MPTRQCRPPLLLRLRLRCQSTLFSGAGRYGRCVALQAKLGWSALKPCLRTRSLKSCGSMLWTIEARSGVPQRSTGAGDIAPCGVFDNALCCRYFTSALPRALLGAAPLAVIGAALERRLRPQFLSALFYVLLYSALPHKVRTRSSAGSQYWLSHRRVFRKCGSFSRCCLCSTCVQPLRLQDSTLPGANDDMCAAHASMGLTSDVPQAQVIGPDAAVSCCGFASCVVHSCQRSHDLGSLLELPGALQRGACASMRTRSDP